MFKQRPLTLLLLLSTEQVWSITPSMSEYAGTGIALVLITVATGLRLLAWTAREQKLAAG